MDLYLLNIRGEDNRFWNKYIIFRCEFITNNKDIYFHNYINSPIKRDLQIQALKHGGDTCSLYTVFTKVFLFILILVKFYRSDRELGYYFEQSYCLFA